MSKCKFGYKYDKYTKQYLRDILIQQSEFDQNKWLMPPETTFIQILKSKSGYTQLFDQSKQEWNYYIDNRNKIIYLKEDSTQISTTSDKLFDPIPYQYTLVQPPDKQNTYKYENNKWIYYFVPIQKQELYNLTYQKKSSIAYNGIYIIKNNIKYLFQTSHDSITMCNSTKIMLETKSDEYELIWKTWTNNQPASLTLTKVQFNHIFQLGLQMINNAFTIEGKLNLEITNMTDQDLADQTIITKFKQKIQTEFSKIPIEFEINAL